LLVLESFNKIFNTPPFKNRIWGCEIKIEESICNDYAREACCQLWGIDIKNNIIISDC